MKKVTIRQVNGALLALTYNNEDPKLIRVLQGLFDDMQRAKRTDMLIDEKLADSLISLDNIYSELKKLERK